MGLHVYTKFGTDADFTEITSYVRYNSVKFDIKLMNDKFKPVQDSVKMQTIHDATLNARFFEASSWMPAYITYDLQTEQMYGYDASDEYGYGTDAYGFLSVGTIFTGAIYPTTKDTYKSHPTEGVSFELVDNSYLLEVDCPAFTYTSSFKVFDPADTAHSVIHQLLYSAGLTDSDISSFNTISKAVGYLSYEAKDETIDKIIEDLLYEYHHVYYFNEDGQFCLYDWQHASITLAGTITDAVIKDKDGIKRERNIYEYDGYLVTYKELLAKSNALVYREDVPAEGNLLIPAQTFPIDGEIKTIKQEYTGKWLSDDADILLTSNHVLELTADAGITKPVETYNNLDAQIVLKNTDIADHRWYRLDIRADATYTDKENEFTLPTTAVLTEEVKLDHIYNDTDALDFANALYNNTVRYGLHTYGFKSEKSFDVGFCYELEHYNVNVLLIGKKYNHYEHIFEYECLSVGAQVVETPDVLYRLPSGVGSDSPSRYLALEVDFNSIDISARGAILVPTITFKVRTIDIPIANVSWSRSDTGSLGLVSGNDYLRTLDTSTVAGEFVTITITALYGGASYSATYTVKKVYQNPVPVYAGVHDSMFYDIGGEPLLAGDCFLYMPKVGEAYDDTNPLFGHVLKWDGDSWESTTDSQSIGFAAKDAFAIARESGKVIFAAVIYTEAMVAANIQAGSGTGLAGSGFRFRAMDDDYSHEGNPKVPVFDVMYDNKKLFEVVATGTNAGDVIIGDYANGNGIKYDKSAGKFSVKGTIEAGSSVPYSTVSGAPPSNADNTSTFFESGTAFQTANGKVKIHNDGTIEAVDGSFTGNIIANSGLFRGIFDTTALRLEPGDANVLSKYVYDNYNQALDLYDYFVTSQGLLGDTYYKINSPTSGTYTFSNGYSSLDFSEVKYIKFVTDSVRRYVRFYDSTYTLLGTIRKRIDGSTSDQLKLNSSFTLAVSYGGDKLIVSSDIPITATGLDDYQIYLSGDTLKVKMP